MEFMHHVGTELQTKIGLFMSEEINREEALAPQIHEPETDDKYKWLIHNLRNLWIKNRGCLRSRLIV